MMNKKPRILIAGNEIGGQMQLLSETFRSMGYKATSVAFNEDFRNFKNDIKINQKNWFKRLLFFVYAIKNYDVFHFFWGISLVSIWRFHLIDLPILKLFGKKIIPHFRGLDIVDIAYFDYLRSKNDGKGVTKPELSRPDQLKKLKKWRKYSNEILVSEPDLFEVVPDAILSPQIIDLQYWQKSPHNTIIKNDIITIVHPPTSRRKKGTEYVLEAVENLKDKGYKIELILIENLESDKVKEIYEKADIGIDQLLYGWHGKVSCELMAMKIPTICYLDNDLIKYRKDIPIVNANPKNVQSIIENLIINKSLRDEIGIKSLEYVKKYHDVKVEVFELLKIYNK